MKKNKINFKDKKYIFPLILLPFVLFIGWQIIETFDSQETTTVQKQEELSTSLGEVRDTILSKNEAYEKFYQSREKRTMISNLDEEKDTLQYYSETLNEKQKRFIDSLEFAKQNKENKSHEKIKTKQSYYSPKNKEEDTDEEKDYKRSLEIIKMLNNSGSENSNNKTEEPQEEEKEEDPLKLMKKQMLFMDSIERARNPELKKQMQAQRIFERNKAKKEAFLNSTLNVTKNKSNGAFNTVSKKKKSNLIKAVIDENIKGYLGSRIRLRVLEDVYVGETKMSKGTTLYALITGFSLQRVNLSVVSVLLEGEILPINLTIYDNDGMKGLYVPQSAFREMMREIGSNTSFVQGTGMGETQSFYNTLGLGVLNSATQTIAKVIRSNKVRLKYNSYVFLVNEKQLKRKK